MKRIFLLLLAVSMVFTQMQAIPAQRSLVKITQPDGSSLSLMLVGDEYLHFNVTEDGYTVVKNGAGYYVYAQYDDNGELVPTALVAHDAEARQAGEKAFLAQTQKFLKPKMAERVAVEKGNEEKRRVKSLEKRRAGHYDYSRFRGLVILVEYSDCEFNNANYKSIITDMITKEDYDGYYDHTNRKINCTGSVLDYYRDNSMGTFRPQFDVVGPVKVQKSKYFPEGTKSEKMGALLKEVTDSADKIVNFKNYDIDGDKVVDMIYFIFAGHGSHITGNNSGLIWPHASEVYSWDERSQNYAMIYKDGVRLGRYACSVELNGGESSRTIDGIGTICHEFSHVLGLPDFYDTDYDDSNGQSEHPGNWSLMAFGCYLNSSRTPAGFSLFERYMVGFAQPEVISAPGSYTLEKLHESNTGYRINTPVNREYFIIENRQQERWDTYLPGHGMLVFRVDSTNASVWSANKINANPAHNYYELVRARGTSSATRYDPFPGPGRVTTLNNVTTPASLLTWSGRLTQYGLLNITENGKVITFDVENTYVLRELTLPETDIVGAGMEKKMTVTPVPEYAVYTLTWKSDDENIARIDQDGTLHGVSVGETVITVESDNGLTASCRVTVREVAETDQIAVFKTFNEDEEAILHLNQAQVLYVYKDDIYLRDATGAIVLNKSGLNLQKNDIVSGKLIGKLHRTNRMPQFVMTRDTPELTILPGWEAAPRQVSVADLSENDYADMIVLKSVPLERDVYTYAIDDDGRRVARLYSVFGISGIRIPTDIENKRFEINAIYGTHLMGSNVIDELYLLASPTEDEDAPTGVVLQEELTGKADAAVYDLQGRKLSPSVLKADTAKKGIYIVNGRKVVVP